METATVKTEEQLRDEWIHRPTHLMYLSFYEWKEEIERPSMVAAVEKIAATPINSTLIGKYDLSASSGRVRHETGKMNKLEAKYAAHLELRKTTGEIVDWRFEPMKLRLAPRTYFDIDFLVLAKDTWGTFTDKIEIELHEVKGHWEDDARIKMKVSATMFPWWKFKGVQWDKATKDWKFEEFNP